MIVGDVADVASRAALSGDERGTQALEKRVEKRERELQARVERRAKSIEVHADALCPRLAERDALESALELRLADNRSLDPLRVD